MYFYLKIICIIDKIKGYGYNKLEYNKKILNKGDKKMGDSLSKVEKNLKALAKRYESVRYSKGLAILFLMLGVNAFSEENVEDHNQN